MKRFTTPTHTFTFPFSAEVISNVRVIYSQDGKQILVKEVGECEITGDKVKVTLTQEETARFDCKKNFVEAEIHGVTADGKAFMSDIIKIPIWECNETEVLSVGE